MGDSKVGCLFPMVIVSILRLPEFGPNDNREDGPHFTIDGYEILQFTVAFQKGHGKSILALRGYL